MILLAFGDPTWISRSLFDSIIFGWIAATLTALLVVLYLYLQLVPKAEDLEVLAVI